MTRCEYCGSSFGINRSRKNRKKDRRRSVKTQIPHKMTSYTGKKSRQYFLDMIKKHQDLIVKLRPTYDSENIIPYHEYLIKKYKETLQVMK